MALIYSMVFSCLMVISGTFDVLTDMIIFTATFFFGLLGVALIKMKRNETTTTGLIAYSLSPIVLILSSIALIINTIINEPVQSVVGLLLILTGVPFYFFYRRKTTDNARMATF